MAAVDGVTAPFVPNDHRDRVRLEDQTVGQPACLAGGGLRGRLIRVPDGDQISHQFPRSHAAPFFPCAVKGMGHGVNLLPAGQGCLSLRWVSCAIWSPAGTGCVRPVVRDGCTVLFCHVRPPGPQGG